MRIVLSEPVSADAVLDGEERGGTAGRNADLGADVLHVMVGCLGGDCEPLGDLAGGETEREEPEHVDLAGAQSSRQRGPSGTNRCRPSGPVLIGSRFPIG